MGGDNTKTYQQPDARDTEQFWTKHGNQENIIKKN